MPAALRCGNSADAIHKRRNAFADVSNNKYGDVKIAKESSRRYRKKRVAESVSADYNAAERICLERQ
jgi:hypothetical protein